MKSNARKTEIRKKLRVLVPRASLEDIQRIEQIALAGHLRHLPPSIVTWQSVTTHIRHVYTDYDVMLEEGYDPDSARYFVVDDINKKLADWGCEKRVGEDA